MNKTKEFAKNTFIIVFGKIFTQLIVFFLLPIYTSVLSVEHYGTVDLIITYVNLLAPLLSLQLENAVFRFLVDFRKDEDNKKKYISTSSYILLITISITVTIVYFLDIFLKVKYLNYMIILIISTIIVNYLLQVARGIGDNFAYATASIIVGVVNVISNIFLLVVFKYGLVGMLISQIIANLLGATYIFFKEEIFKYQNYKYINKNIAFEMLKYSLPLIPSNICWWIINVSDRTIISIMLSVGKNGIYSVANKFSTAFVMVFNMVNLSWTETVSLHINDEDRDVFFSNMINMILKIFSGLMFCIIAVIPFVFNILVDNSYNEAYMYIPALLLGSLFNVAIGLFSGIYMAKKMTKEMAKTSLIASFINIAINLIFIKYLNLWAAILSTILSFAIVTIYRFIDIKKYIMIKFDIKFILSLIIIFLISYILYFINNMYSNIVNAIILVGYSLLINKDIINSTIKNKRRKI